MKRVRHALLVAAVLCALALVAGCSGQSAGREAADALDSQLSAIAEGDVQTASPYLDASLFSTQDYGVSAQTFESLYFDGFAYSVGDVDVSGDTATVDVTVSVRDVNQALESLHDAAVQAAEDGADASSDSYADAALAEIYAADPWETSQLDGQVTMVEGEDGTWSVADPGTFGSLLLGGYDQRQVLS